MPVNHHPALTEDLWSHLKTTAQAACADQGCGHDWLHVHRVSGLADQLAVAEGADRDVLRAAALLHELVNHPKNHPRSAHSGEDCAQAARELLASVGADPIWAERVAECIGQHAWSAAKTPTTLESALLQDADRLDALGAVGLARCFATAERMKSLLYHPDDPAASHPRPADQRLGLGARHLHLQQHRRRRAQQGVLDLGLPGREVGAAGNCDQIATFGIDADRRTAGGRRRRRHPAGVHRGRAHQA